MNKINSIFIHALILIYIFNCKLITSQSFEDQQPRGIHLVYGEDPTNQLNIFWWTKVKTTSAIVYYNLVDVENEDLTLEINSCIYNQSAKGFLAQNQTNGKYIQRVLLKNLAPNRLYCYEIKSGDTTSNIYSFRTAGPSIDYHKLNYKHYKDASFIVYGGETEFEDPIRNIVFPQSFQENLLNKFRNSHLYGLINMGDVYIKEYSLTSSKDEKDFFESGNELFSRMSILPTFGSFYDLKNLKLFRNMFTFMNEWPLKSFWYSMDINGAHFISFSTDLFIINETLSNNESSNDNVGMILEKQINWLKSDLQTANSNRLSVPWIIVLARQPMYCTTNCPLNCKRINCIQKDELIRNKLESMFYQYGVDLILESSETIYSRTFPVIKNGDYYEKSYKNVDMPVHVAIPRTIRTDNQYSMNNDNWIAFKYNSESNFNYGQITVVNKTHLNWSFLLPNDTIVDNITIVKDYHGIIHSESFLEKKIVQTIKENKITQNKIKIVLVTCGFLILISIIGFYVITFIKRYKEKQRFKHFTQYANLIESELEA